MSLDHPPAPLEVFGNYDLLNKLGAGGMGAVYRARHRENGEIVAIKIMPAHLARNPVHLKRFEQEFRVTSKLDHPNIVRAIEYGVLDQTPFIVMEFIQGESLGAKLDREGRMTEEEALRIIIQVGHGLHRAHRQGLIHRDIKPDNILVMPDGKAKITDLGLVKEADAAMMLTQTGRGLGTPNFMAPEQFRNAKNVSIRCDIYSLAATLYHMVTGAVPFPADDAIQVMTQKLANELVAPRQLAPKLSERTEWAIRRAMSADAEQRPASCREFVEDLTGHSTRRPGSSQEQSVFGGKWYVVYLDADGAQRTATRTTEEMRQALQTGQLGNSSQVQTSRSPAGPFASLHEYPQFRDLVVGPAPGPPLSEQSIASLSKRFPSLTGGVISAQPASTAVAFSSRPAPDKRCSAREESPRDLPAEEAASSFKPDRPTEAHDEAEATNTALYIILAVIVTTIGALVASQFLFR